MSSIYYTILCETKKNNMEKITNYCDKCENIASLYENDVLILISINNNNDNIFEYFINIMERYIEKKKMEKFLFNMIVDNISLYQLYNVNIKIKNILCDNMEKYIGGIEKNKDKPNNKVCCKLNNMVCKINELDDFEEDKNINYVELNKIRCKILDILIYKCNDKYVDL
jgi:hypothetical protein